MDKVKTFFGNLWDIRKNLVTTMGAGVELWLQKEIPGNCPEQEF